MSQTDATRLDNETEIDVKFELSLEIQIDEYLDELVDLAEAQVKKSGILAQRDFGKAQLSNASAVAASTTNSFQIIQNWIRYQAGRGNNGWKILAAETSMLGDLKKLKTKAVEMVENAVQYNKLNFSDESKSIQSRQLHIRLTRLYLGYFTREFRAQKPAEGDQKDA